MAGGPIARARASWVLQFAECMQETKEAIIRLSFFPAHLANLSIYCFIAQEPKKPQLHGKLYPTIRDSLNGARKIKSIDQIKVLAKRRRGRKEGKAPNRDRLFVGVRRNRTKKSQMRCIVCLLRVQFHGPVPHVCSFARLVRIVLLFMVGYVRRMAPSDNRLVRLCRPLLTLSLIKTDVFHSWSGGMGSGACETSLGSPGNSCQSQAILSSIFACRPQ